MVDVIRDDDSAEFFDGTARHTPEGYGFTKRAAEAGWREAVRERDEPFGDSAFS
jgi:enoyl-CoA hydratase